jgi:hypothetical protein
MTLTTSRPHAESLMRFLKQRSEQLEVFHSGNARLIIQQFCDFFDRDDIVSFIAQGLLRRLDTSPKVWHEQALREGQLPPMPATRAGCMAFRYAVLKQVRMDKLDLRHFVSNVFPGSYLDEKLMRWKRLIVHPFGSDCRTLADGVIARLPEGDWVDMEALVGEYLDGPFESEGFGQRAWDDADDRRVEDEEKQRKEGRVPAAAPPRETSVAATQKTTRAHADDAADAALDALDAAVRQATLDDAARGDLLLDVAALRVELTRGRREVARFEARLADVAARGGLAAACDRVRAALA